MSNRIAWIASFLLVACAAVSSGVKCRFSDGSNSCDTGPVLATQLEGEWISDVSGEHLAIEPRDNEGVTDEHYIRSSEFCEEEGWLYGGLEFYPTLKTCALNAPNVLEPYSASVDWTETGIAVFYDARHVERFTYVGE